MSLEEKVGQLFVPAFTGSTPGRAAKMIKQYHVGGVIYFPGNARGPRQTAELSNALQRASKIPLLIGVDEEQGLVTRLSYVTRLPGNMALGATRRPADTRAAAEVTAAELRAVGINQDYAPVADVNVNPANPVIGIRSYGSDPGLVAEMVGAAVDGYQGEGVVATAKHFPGHGDTATDSHTGLPVIRHTRRQWESVDAPPFRAAIEHRVDAIMSAHIVVPRLDRSGDPSTLSRTVLTGMLRNELGHDGVIVTDSLQMAGARQKYGDAAVAVRAFKAGADQLLMPPSLAKAHNAVLRAVRGGAISRQRLDESVTRILRLKQRRGVLDAARTDPAKAARVIGSAQHRAVARRVAEHSVTLVRNDGVLPLRAGRKVHVTGPRSATLITALRKQGLPIAPTATSADVVVVTTLNARGGTATRVRVARGRPVVVAALGEPYDLGRLPATGRTPGRAELATYSSSAVSVEALGRVLTGAVKPTGRLPVTIPGGARFGHGLGL